MTVVSLKTSFVGVFLPFLLCPCLLFTQQYSDSTMMESADSIRRINPSDFVFSYREAVTLSITDSLNQDEWKLAEFAEKLTFSLKGLKKMGYQVEEIIITAYLDEKKLGEEKIDTQYIDSIESAIFIDEKEIKQRFGFERKLITNKWEFELYKLEWLKREIASLGLLKSDQITIKVITVDVSKNPVTANLEFSAKVVSPVKMQDSINCIRFSRELQDRLSNFFTGMDFEVIENLGAETRDNNIIFYYSNYETVYHGLPDVQKYAVKVKEFVDELVKCKKIKSIEFSLDTYEGRDFFSFPSEHLYAGEHGPEVKISYQFSNAKEEVSIITKRKINILEQELLKLYELERLLTNGTNGEYKVRFCINPALEVDQVVTRIRVFY